MANNLRKFNTYSDYEAAELVKPAVSLIAATDEVYFDQKEAPVPPTPTFSGLTVYYNITDISQPTVLFNGGGGSGSGNGSGGVLPSAMIIDGTAVEVTNTYQFSTTGEHIVNYSFADNAIPRHFLDGQDSTKFNTVTKVEIGDTLTSFGTYAFNWCRSLTSCTIGSGVTSIGDSTFNGCSGLTSVTIPNSVTSIGFSAFQECRSLTSCTIPNSVVSIGDNVFRQCTSLTSIDIPDSVTSIGGSAFDRCTGLTSVTIGNSVTSIGDNVFRQCTSLTSIDIPNSVAKIGIQAFYECSSLTSIVIPSGVTSIGTQAFQNCTSLTSIICNAVTAPTITNYTFYEIKTGGTLTVPSGSSGYDVWMQNANYYLGLYGWTKVEQ